MSSFKVLKMTVQLIDLCENNRDYFRDDKSESGVKLHANFSKISEFLNKSAKLINDIESFAGDYDFDYKTPANGYRSFIHVFKSAVDYADKICNQINNGRGNSLFRKSFYAKEIDVTTQMIESLFQVGEGLVEIHKISEHGTLYSKNCHHDNIITRASKVINQECFYGRSTAFQYFDSLRPVIKLVASTMASYSDFYYSKTSIFWKMFYLISNSSKYFLDPEICAQRICDINKNADIHFLSSLMRLCDNKLAHMLINITGQSVEVNRAFEIRPEPLKLFSLKLDKFVDIPIPSSHVGVKPIQCRLISARRRMAMIGEEAECSRFKSSEPSKYLLFHVHGGGWISQSSQLHEIYLREWAVKLDVPILSIDYSLAPEAPFPRALEEVFYAYCWVLKNTKLVGSTCENIVFAGDSAGGNLVTSCIIKCIEMGIPKPQGLFNVYSIFLVNLVKTPSRFMGLFDSFLTYGTVLKIFKSYGCGTLLNEAAEIQSSVKPKKYGSSEIPEASESDYAFEIAKSYLLSPYWAPDYILKQFPPSRTVTITTDPCLDDCIDFSKKLKRLNVDTQIDVLERLPHGFLILSQMSKECHDGSMACMRNIAELLGLNIE